MTVETDIESLTTQEKTDFRTAIGVDTAISSAVDAEAATRAAADAALQATINGLSAQSGVPASYTATNPSIQADNTWQPAIKREITFDSSVVSPSFSSIQLESNIMYATYGVNNVDAAAKTTFTLSANTLSSPAHGQRILYANTIEAIGCGDAVISDNTITYYGGLEDGGGEGVKWYRNVIEQGRYIFKSTITGVARSTVNTTLTQNITKNKNAQTVTVADATGVSVGQWIQFDVGSPGSTAYAKAEAVKVLAVSGNNITARFDNNHTTGALVKGSVVLTFSGGTGTGQGRYCVNLSHSGYGDGVARKNTANQMLGTGTSWANSMVGGDVNNPGVISFDADNVTSSPFSVGDPLRVYYPIASVASSTSLVVYRRDQVGVAIYNGLATSDSAYRVRPGARVMAGDPITNRYYSVVVLESNEFSWSVGNQVEWAHSSSNDVSGATWRFVCYSPGMTYRTGLEISNAGPQEFQTGILVGTYGANAGWATGAQISGATTCLLLAASKSTGKAIQINVGNGNSGRIEWIAQGQYLEYDSVIQGLKFQTNKGGTGSNNGLLSVATPAANANSVLSYVGNIKLTTPAESSAKITQTIAGGTEWTLEYDATGPIFRRNVAGTITSFRPTMTQI